MKKAATNDHTYCNDANKNYEANILNSDKILRCPIIVVSVKCLQK